MSEANKSSKRRVILILTVSAAVIAAAAAVTWALLVKQDSIENTFTLTDLDISLSETDWTAPATNVAPGTILPKNPVVTNDDDTPAYVFLEVTVPYLQSGDKVDNADGTKISIGDTAVDKAPMYKFVITGSPDLYNQEYTKTTQKVRDLTVSSGNGWQLVEESYDTTNYKITYVYAYVQAIDTLKALAKDASTPALFDKIYVSNFSVAASRQNGDYNIDIKAYGIQTEYLVENVQNSALTPAQVWTKIENNGA